MHTHAHSRSRWGLVNQSLPLVHHKYSLLNELTDISQCHQSKVVWRTFESEKPAPRQSVRYFSSLFFFLQQVLMLWPYAGGCRADNRPQCADRPRLPTLTPPFPSNSLPYRATNWPLWEPSTAPSTRTGLEPLRPQPPFLPKTPSAHIHLTLPLSVLTTYPPKTCFPVWL